jgi:hypothetical protein
VPEKINLLKNGGEGEGLFESSFWRNIPFPVETSYHQLLLTINIRNAGVIMTKMLVT